VSRASCRRATTSPPVFALRGAISTGFKAPALQQQYFSYVATNLVTTIVRRADHDPDETGTFRS
jgi:hypothetical protein